MPTFYEFFAGGGMARAGLGNRWECLLVNDIDPKKAACYALNWGGERLRVGSVGELTARDLPGRADLAWASFPCQDLSLAGACAGLNGERSGTFWLFWRLIEALTEDGRAPTSIVLENVCGALTSHGGADFAAIGSALAGAGYRFGALVIDAVHFVPQSRPRLFVIAVRKPRAVPAGLAAGQPDPTWHTETLAEAYRRLPGPAKNGWVWWRLPHPPKRTSTFADLIDENLDALKWHTPVETLRLLSLMTPLHRRKVDAVQRTGRRTLGGVYRRTRTDDGGRRIQRAEVRFDDVAGCLRTPAGGSSRQTILIVEGDRIQSRLLSSREAARLMGLPDSYLLPERYNEAYHLAGDGVVVPVVRFLAANLLEPLLAGSASPSEEAA